MPETQKKTRAPRKGTKLKRTAKYAAKLENVKQFIREYWEKKHYSPSIAELTTHFETSTGNVSYWLKHLESDGWIEPRESGVARNIVPVEIFADRPVFPFRFGPEEEISAISTTLKEKTASDYDPETDIILDGHLLKGYKEKP